MGSLCGKPSKEDPFSSPGRTIQSTPQQAPTSDTERAPIPARAGKPVVKVGGPGRTIGGGAGGGAVGAGGGVVVEDARAAAARAAEVMFSVLVCRVKQESKYGGEGTRCRLADGRHFTGARKQSTTTKRQAGRDSSRAEKTDTGGDVGASESAGERP